MRWIDKLMRLFDNGNVDRVPALAVGLIMAIYWARVLRLAWKQRRRTGRAGNLWPAERLGRVLRLVWFPAVGFWIVLPVLAGLRWSDERLQALSPTFRPVFRSPFVSWAALAVALLAFGLTWVCWRRMGRSWRMGIDPDDRTRLVVTGPYAYTRHPIYALSSVLMICTMAIVPTPAMIVVCLVHLGLLQWEARREERYLTAVHGASYADYAARTGRFWPRVR